MSKFHILYLDKDRFIAEQVKMRLKWKGYKVTTTAFENDFIGNHLQYHYDLIIVDFLTPSINAFSFLRLLKERGFNLPIIIVNSDNNPQLIEKSICLGFADYIIKTPLIHNFIDQLSYSIVQSIAKPYKKKLAFKKTSQLEPLHSQKPTTKKTNWEYILSKEEVNWSSSLHSDGEKLSYKDFISSIHSDDITQVKINNNICLFSHSPVEYRFRYLSKNKTATFYATIKADIDKKGTVYRLFGSLVQEAIKITKAEENVKIQLSFLKHTTDALFITDAQKNIISVNKAFTTMFGYSENKAIVNKTDLLNTAQFDTSFFNDIAKRLNVNCFWQGEVAVRHKDGHSIPTWQSTCFLKDNNGNIFQSMSILRDIRPQKNNEKQIKLQANHDPLTSLPNRSLFIDRLKTALNRTQRQNKKLALMLLDLNQFKWVNDNLGHHIGDFLLQETAKKLLAATRKSDTVARLGGDEFCIILPELEKTTDAELIVRKIFKSFRNPIQKDQQEVFISGSIGISIFPDDGSCITTLQKNADSAMYMAKNKNGNGNNNFYYFTQALQRKTEKRLKLITDMRSAMQNQEFSLHYQPIIDLHNNKVTSAETLLRWNHPQSGYIPLDDFLPLAEESGLIREIGIWVINEVAKNMQRWSALGLSPIKVSLNQSAAQYTQSECHIEWLEILNKKQIPPNNITFEITEKLFIEDQKYQLSSIKKLKQQGVKISLDSFGTGYSSLSYLKKFPVDEIKIDRSYIHKMINDSSYEILVETIIELTKKLGIKVVATGIETKEQLDLLHHHCQYAQGYYFSNPLPLNEFELYIKGQNEV